MDYITKLLMVVEYCKIAVNKFPSWPVKTMGQSVSV